MCAMHSGARRHGQVVRHPGLPAPKAIPVTWKPLHAPAHSSEPHSGHLSHLRRVPCHCWTTHGPACPSHQGQGCVQGLLSSALSFQTAAAEAGRPAARNLAFPHTYAQRPHAASLPGSCIPICCSVKVMFVSHTAPRPATEPAGTCLTVVPCAIT